MGSHQSTATHWEQVIADLISRDADGAADAARLACNLLRYAASDAWICDTLIDDTRADFHDLAERGDAQAERIVEAIDR